MTKINQKTFTKALEKSGGNQSIIAQRLDVTRGAVTRYLQKYPKMKDLCELESERIIDVAENNIDHDIVKNKSIETSKWKLANSKRGKARGYGPKIEQEMSGGTDNKIEVEIIEVIKSEDENSDEEHRD